MRRIGSYSSYSNDYDSFTTRMNMRNPYDRVSSTSVSSDLVDVLANAYKRKYAYDPWEERTGLNRAFDLLLTPNYMVAGFVKGMVDNGQENDISPWQGAWRGIKAGNPIGDGYNQGRTTFSDVLETAGWKPTSTLGKIAKGVSGFALDVLFDPTTYISGGLSAVVKGTGRAGLRGFEQATAKGLAERYGIQDIGNIADLPTKIRDVTLSKLSGKGYNDALVNRVANKNYDDAMSKLAPTMGGMSEDMAKDIIKQRSFARGVKVSDEQVTKDAESLMKRYNSIVGLKDSTRFDMKLANAPFGEKLFGWTGIADKALFSMDTSGIAKLSDKLKVSSVYSTIRKSVYGSQFGRLFSNNSKLFQLSKGDPGTLYDYMSALDKFQGLKLEKMELEKAVRSEAEKMKLDLDPSEMKTVLKLMQDKKAWRWITSKIKFGDSEEGKAIKAQIDNKKKILDAHIADLYKMKDEIDALVIHDDHLKAIKENDMRIGKENIDAMQFTRNEVLPKLQREYENRIIGLRSEIRQARDMHTNTQARLLEQLDELDLFGKSSKNISEMSRSNNERLIQEFLDSKKNYESHHEKIKALEEQLKPINRTTHDKPYLSREERLQNQANYQHNFPINREIRDLKAQNVTYITQKESLVKALGDFFFRDESVISRGISDSEIQKIIDMIQSGRTEEEIQRYMRGQKNVLSGQWKAINQFIAETIGYGESTRVGKNRVKFAGWKEFYTERISPILEKERKAKQINDRYNTMIKRLEDQKVKVVSEAQFEKESMAYFEKNYPDGNKRDLRSVLSKLKKERAKIISENKKIDTQINRVRKLMEKDKELKQVHVTPDERRLKNTLEVARKRREDMRYQFSQAKSMEDIQLIKSRIIDDSNINDYYENPDLYNSPHFPRGRTTQEKIRDNLYNNDVAKSDTSVTKKSGTYGDGASRTETVNVSSWDKTERNPYDTADTVIDVSKQDEKEIYQDIIQQVRAGKFDVDEDAIRNHVEKGNKNLNNYDPVNTQKLIQYRMMTKMMPDLLKNIFKMNYHNLTDDQKILLYDLSLNNVQRSLKKQPLITHIGDAGKKVAEILKQRKIDEKLYRIESVVRVGSHVSWPIKQVTTPAQIKKNAVYRDNYIETRVKSIDKVDGKRVYTLVEVNDNGKAIREFKNIPASDVKISGALVNPGSKVLYNERKLISPAQDAVAEVVETKWINGRVHEVTTDQTGGKAYSVIDKEGNTVSVKPYQLIEGRIGNIGVPKTVDELEEIIVDDLDFTHELALKEDELRSMLKDSSNKYKVKKKQAENKMDDILLDYERRRNNLEESIKEMQRVYSSIVFKSYDELDATLPSQIVDIKKQIDDAIGKLGKMEKVLNDDDALESYVRGLPKFGDAYVDKAKSEVSLAYLDANKEYGEKVIETVKFLKDKFAEMAKIETKIGKLKDVQVNKMIDRYVPHILTDEGDAFFKVYRFAEDEQGNLIAVEKNLDKNSSFLTQDLGYGKVWNPHGQSRTFRIKTDKLDKNGNPIWIKNPTIEQINEYLQKFPDIMKKLQGSPLFSEDIAEIYLQRGLRHLDLFYDNRYMETMIHNFGNVIKNFDDIGKGYKAVANVTKLKNTIGQLANTRRSEQMSAEASIEMSVKYKEIGKRANGQMWEQMKADSRAEIRGKYNDMKDRALQLAKDELSRMAKEYLRDQRSRGIKGKIDLPKLERDKFKELYNHFYNDILNKEGKPTFTELTDEQKNAIYQDKFKRIIEKEGEPELRERSPEEMAQMFQDHYTNVVKEMGLEPKMLNEAATPMLQLERHQFDAIRKLEPKSFAANGGLIRAVNESIVQRANQAKMIQIVRDSSKLLKIYDKFTRWFKLNQTTVLPSFHIRNGMSNLFQGWLGVGNDVFNPKMHLEALQTVRSNGKQGSSTFERLEKDGTKVQMTWNEAFEKAVAYDVVDKGMFAVDIGAQDASKGFLKFLPSKLDPTDTEKFKLYEGFDPKGNKWWVPIGGQFGNMVENKDRLLQFVSHLKQGKSFDEARDMVNKYLFDYSDITHFEATVMKRVIPFYVWMRKNAKLQLSSMLDQPGKYQLMAKYENGITGMNNQEDRLNFNFVNEFAKDWIQLPFTVINEEGRKEPVLLNPALPFLDLSRIPNPLKPVESFRNFVSTMNPQLKIPFEQIMNKQFFFQQPIVQGDRGEAPTQEDQAMGRADHVASHVSLYNLGKDLVTKSGLDWGLELFAAGSGVKALSYDYDRFKFQILQERINRPKEIGEIGYDAIVKGFKSGYHFVTSRIGDTLDKLNSGRPMEAGEYTGALAPISQMAYNKLSKDEQKRYIPPTNGEVIAFNAEAQRLSNEEYAKSGKRKNFVWTLLEDFGLGKERGYTIGHVTHVADGDTFTVMVGNEKKSVRMLLVDTPETVKPDTPEMPFGKQASDHTKKSLIDKDVRLVFEPRSDKTDKYGRILAYVKVDGTDYNKSLIEEGYGKYRYNYNNYSRAEDYKAAERSAYDQNEGIWKLKSYADLNLDTPYMQNVNIQNKYKELLKSMGQ